MIERNDNERAQRFAPDWVSPPGDTILDLVEERGWTQQQLADRMGCSLKHVNQLIKARVPLSEDIATRLQSVLGSSIGFWLTREARYRERVALVENAKRNAKLVPWLERFPLKELMDLNVLPRRRVDAKAKPELVSELLNFFGVASPTQWETQYGCMEMAFRRSRPDQADIAAISAWLRIGEREAEKNDVPKYDKSKFELALDAIRRLTCEPPEVFEPQMRHLLHDSGVIFLLVPSIRRAHVSGVARWLSGARPMIQLSLYGKTNDKFWFTFFHEAAHILLHADTKEQRKSVFLDDPNLVRNDDPKEHEANVCAGDRLIPPECVPELRLLRTKQAVCAFAKRIGIHPGIVVGRLQHDRLIEPSWMNDLKVSFLIR